MSDTEARDIKCSSTPDSTESLAHFPPTGVSEPTLHSAPTRFTPPPADDPMLGADIDNYHVTGVLGKGGFGIVYRAEDVKLKRPVALKFLRNASEQRNLKLFEREAKVLASLCEHPGIVQIYGWGEYNNQVYFALEFMPQSAEKVLHVYPEGLPMVSALQIIAQACDALAFAHKKGVLHRDIKPENILLNHDETQAKVTDFGLARLSEGSSEGSILAGAISGSPPYMSPEQAAGEKLDHRSDIFSLGVTLYVLLTGERPFDGPTPSRIMERIRNNDRVSIDRRRPDLPEHVRAVVKKAMEFERQKRYQNAADFVADIRRSIAIIEGKKPEPRFAFGRWAIAGISIVVLIGLVVAAVLVGRMNGSATAPSNPSIERAKALLDQGDYTTAQREYEGIVSTEPNSDTAKYGLGYALLRQSKYDGANSAFAGITNTRLNQEGRAAVAYQTQGESSRSMLEDAERDAATAYPSTLLGSLDISHGAHKDAIDRLKNAEGYGFNFGWQELEYLQTLGRAHFGAGEYDKALEVFERLARMAPESTQRIAASLMEMTKSKLDSAQREAVRSQATRIRELIQSGTAPTEAQLDTWTSRPIRVLLLKPSGAQSRWFYDSGMAEVMPFMLGKVLTEKHGLEVVNRDLLDEVLAEQELSALVGSEQGKLQLGRVMGARVIVEPKLMSAMGQDTLSMTAVDAETTIQLYPESVNVQDKTSPDALIDQLGERLADAVKKSFPVQGRLTRSTGDGTEINIGALVGVAEGMRFSVSTRPDRRYVLPDKFVEVVAPVGNTSTPVTLHGFQGDDIDQSGWWVAAQ